MAMYIHVCTYSRVPNILKSILYIIFQQLHNSNSSYPIKQIIIYINIVLLVVCYCRLAYDMSGCHPGILVVIQVITTSISPPQLLN